jgi:hypothetical protein
MMTQMDGNRPDGPQLSPETLEAMATFYTSNGDHSEAAKLRRIARAAHEPKLDLDALTDDPDPVLTLLSRGNSKVDSNPPDVVGKESQATRLVTLALERYDFGVSSTHIPFLVPKNGPRYARALKGGRPSLSSELAKAFHAEYGGAPSKGALTDALAVLEGYAQEGAPVELAKRVGKAQDGIVLDLGTPDGRAVLVTRDGWWKVVDQSPVLFRRSNSMLALPEPVRGGSLDGLRGLLNVSSEHFDLVVAWLVAALFPDIPHAILVLQGEQGTAKTSATKMLARTIDPQSAQTRALPGSHRDWIQAASGNHVIALDNVSHIERWQSDALARAVTGEGWVTRTLYEDDDQMVFEFRNVLLINGIDLGALRGDLAERMASVELQPIPQEERRKEDDLWARFDVAHPAVLGALLDLASEVLRVLPTIHLDTLPRMADFAHVVAAVDLVRGTSALDTYLGLAEALNADVVASDPVALAIEGFVRRNGEFNGTSAELLAQLESHLKKTQADGWWKAPRGWPNTAAYMGRVVRRLAPALRSQGIAVEQIRSKTERRIHLRMGDSAEKADTDGRSSVTVGDSRVTVETVLPSPSKRRPDQGKRKGVTVVTVGAGTLPWLGDKGGEKGTPGKPPALTVTTVTAAPDGGVVAGQGGFEGVTVESASTVTVPSPPASTVTAPVCVCTSCGYQARRTPRRADGISTCPKCQRSMVATAEKWGRLSNKPLPAVLLEVAA